MTDNQKLKGIGGWLIFPVIGLFVNGIIFLSDIIKAVIDTELWTLSPMFMVVAIFLDLLLIGIVVITLVFMFSNKKKSIPLFILYLWSAVGINFVFTIFGAVDEYLLTYNIFFGIVWTIYILRSKRVKATFTKD